MFHITAIFEGKSRICELKEAFEAVEAELKCDVALHIYDTGDIDRNEIVFTRCKEDMEQCDFALLYFHGSMAYFKRYLSFRDLFEGKKPYFFRSTIDSEMEEMMKRCKLPQKQIASLLSYLEAGGTENLKNFIRYLLKHAAGIDCKYEPVFIPKWDGIFRLQEGMTEEAYIKRIVESGKPVIGILMHFHSVQTEDTAHLDSLLEIVKAHGCEPLPVYTNVMPSSDGSYGGLRAALKRYMRFEGKTAVHAVIVTTGHSLSILSAPGCGMEAVSDSVFELLGVPALHALVTNFTYEQWVQSLRGMDPVYLGNVYTAEYDGQLVTVPFACMEQVQTPFGIKEKMVLISERAEKIVRLAKNWAILSMLKNGDKKVAIILHNMPPRADMIGCAYGLDTPQSVYNLILSLQENGIKTDYDFADGREIIDKITAGLTNDGRFLSGEQLLERASAVIHREDWERWFTDFPDKVKEELLRDWGFAPGEFMTVGEKILVPGIINGNIMIGLQPPRALEEKAEECCHSTDIVCPYQYLAFYRYVEKVFGANVVVHVGTHGTIEWLPGKEIGLSKSCYPDLGIGDLPHLYPYIIDVPGEGAQAKRRTAACILDHLIPSMTESGSYGELVVIDELLSKYYHAKQNGNAKTTVIMEEIQELASRLGLDRDLELGESAFEEDFEKTAQQLHLWISEIKASEIKDGLHIFGQAPQNERMQNMLRLLVRVKNGNTPSLRQGICPMMHLNADQLIDAPHQVNDCGVTNAMLLEQADEMGRTLFENWEKSNYSPEAIEPLVDLLCADHGLSRKESGALITCLRFVCQEVYPRVLATTDELSSFISGINGEFVRKGPSGAPSRGNAGILPTGRNFYTIDPNEVPSRAAWETGIKLGKQLIERHTEETGQFPESIAIVVYAGETMKTNGDDIAEILYLYGIRPVWLGATDRVIGLEAMPLQELGRARIDVTLRITGLFRDNFPNLINLVDEAVNIAASQEETHKENFIRKHVDEDLKTFMDRGMGREQAYERAAVRIFGCPPGTYGAGVDILINSKKWEKDTDLGDAYITWSGHGYSRKMHGDKQQELFAHRLSGCDATVKNISSCESDMLDSDDFYNYHGGLISAVKAKKGVNPASYSANTADMSHVVTKNIHREATRIMRARINNPKWIEGLKQHGYKGAQEFSAMVDILFGWDATSGVVDDYMYDMVFETYLHDHELREWIGQENPYALHAMSERLLEAAQRGMWNAGMEQREELQEIYLAMEGSLEGAE